MTTYVQDMTNLSENVKRADFSEMFTVFLFHKITRPTNCSELKTNQDHSLYEVLKFTDHFRHS